MRKSSCVALLFLAVAAAGAQPRPSQSLESLTLEQAIQLALGNNPAYRRVQNTLRTADAQVRSAYGALLPTSGASFGANYQQGGSQVVQGIELKGQDTYSTSYNFSVNYQISSGAIFAPRA